LTDLPRIASLWIGGALSWLEQLCLRSFVDAGHDVTLYSYEPIANLPHGIANADAGDIFRTDGIIRHTRTGSPAIHADVWRLYLLQKTDSIWVDSDVYCYRPFDFAQPHVFGLEKPGLVCNAVAGLPSDSPALAALLRYFGAEVSHIAGDAPSGAHLGDMPWGSTGPGAFTDALNESGEITFAQPQSVFYPVSFRDRNKMILSRFRIEDWLREDTCGIHLWARRMKPRLAEKENNRPRRGSFLDQLLRKHGIEPAKAPLPGWTPRTAVEIKRRGKTPDTGDAVQLLLDGLNTHRLTRVVDVGANPLTPPPYQTLLDMGGCEIIGFEPHPEAFEDLKARNSQRETYFPFAIGDGGTERLNIYRESGLTSIFEPYEGAFAFLDRSRRNVEVQDVMDLETRALDDIDEITEFDLLKIDIQGAETKVFRGATKKMAGVLAVIPEVRFYQLYKDEPMFGGVDLQLRSQGFQLHKVIEPKGKVIPNSQIHRLKRTEHRNQIIDADAIYLRDLGQPDAFSDEQFKHLAILAASVFHSHDLALACLDRLAERGAVAPDLAECYVDALPEHLRKL